MGFAHVKQWRRHQAIIDASSLDRLRVICQRCQIELPISIVPGTIVLSKEDRLYIGDDVKAVDCEL